MSQVLRFVVVALVTAIGLGLAGIAEAQWEYQTVPPDALGRLPGARMARVLSRERMDVPGESAVLLMRMQGAKKLVVEVTLHRIGRRIVTFDTDGFYWPGSQEAK